MFLQKPPAHAGVFAKIHVMKNALILHGTGATSKGNWIPWLKGELEHKGYEVYAPDLPGADRPNIEKYNEHLLSQGWTFNEDSIFIGHSSGSLAILGLLAALPEQTKINHAVLVGTFTGDLGRNDLTDIRDERINFEIVKKRAKKFTCLHSDDDPICPVDGAKEIALRLGAEFVLVHGYQHFSYSTIGEKSKEIPHVLEILEKV